MKQGKGTYYMKSFFFIFMLQSLFSLAVNYPTLMISAYQGPEELGWKDYLGLSLFAAGYITEVVAD